MKTLEALRETEIISHDKGTVVAKLFNGVLYWYNIEKDEYHLPVKLDDINKLNWQPYHEVKEIRPEKAGELWKAPNGAIFLTYKETEILYFATKGTHHKCFNNEETLGSFSEWTRLYPPVEDESVERIEIEGVEWFDGTLTESGRNGPLVIYPETGLSRDEELEFVNGPSMKMILEIPKDKP